MAEVSARGLGILAIDFPPVTYTPYTVPAAIMQVLDSAPIAHPNRHFRGNTNAAFEDMLGNDSQLVPLRKKIQLQVERQRALHRQRQLNALFSVTDFPDYWADNNTPRWSFDPNGSYDSNKANTAGTTIYAVADNQHSHALRTEIATLFNDMAEYQRTIGYANRGTMNDSMWKCPQHEDVNPLERHTLLYDWGGTKR